MSNNKIEESGNARQACTMSHLNSHIRKLNLHLRKLNLHLRKLNVYIGDSFFRMTPMHVIRRFSCFYFLQPMFHLLYISVLPNSLHIFHET